MANTTPNFKFSLTIPKLKGIIRLLKSHEMLAEPLRDAMEEVGRYGYSQAIVNAPFASGRTINQMRYRVQQKPIPLWVAVKTTAVNPKTRYSYPRRLNYDRRSKHRAWFDRAIQATERVWPHVLQRATREIARRWARGG